MNQIVQINILQYYLDTSVFPENTLLVKFI